MRKRFCNSSQIALFPMGEPIPGSIPGRQVRHYGRTRSITSVRRETVLRLTIKKLHPDAVIPSYAHGPKEDAAMDLSSVERRVLSPGVAIGVPTGIAIELPPGCEAQVRPRSGMALKHSVTVNFGTIDPGYRGEIRVVMFNLGKTDYVIEKGDRIAQLVIARYEPVEWEEGDELTDSQRGAGGFGSSGR
jgi:dUTP pyrophosphatase